MPILCCALRFAVRLWDCFFFGTAIEGRKATSTPSTFSDKRSRCDRRRAGARPPRANATTRALFELQLAQLGPARIARRVVMVPLRLLVEVRRADRTQTPAVHAAEHLRGHRKDERVARPRREVQAL